MAYDFSRLQQHIVETGNWLAHELSGVRTGRAAPALLDGVTVMAYGAHIPLNQVASVTVEDPRTLRITAWDVSHIKAIEKSIIDANLGVSVASDEGGVRVSFPELTADRRTALMKIAHGRLEEARVRLRSMRDETWSDIQEMMREGDLSEDDKFRLKDSMQKMIDEGNAALEASVSRKEVEIQN